MPAPRSTSQRASLVEHLNAQAPTKRVNEFLSLQKYYASAELLLRQASTYRTTGNEEQLYVMLMRYASLIIETIPAHKDYSKTDSKYQQLKKVLLERYFPELEKLKVSLRTRDIAEPVARSSNRPADAVMLSTSNLPQLNWAAAVPPAPPSAPPLPDPLVDDLLDMLSGGGSSSRPAASSPPQPPSAASSSSSAAPPLPSYQPKYLASNLDMENKHALFSRSSSNRGGQSTSARYPAGTPDGSAPKPALPPSGSLPRYPALDALALSGPPSSQQHQRLQEQLTPHPSAGPSLGPQEVQVITTSYRPGAPGSCSDPAPPEPGPLQLPPAPSDSSSSSSASAPGGVKELKQRAQLRDVHVSVALMEEFLHFAARNTGRGIESCGILAGVLSANDSIFTITTLIIPKQQGTSDTVQALNEEEIFDVQFQRELYPLGWIHTHPTQTCFLSSVDIHTHCGYQTMLDEAVAIVMAPTDRTKKCGIFRLSTPGGLSLIQKCTQRGFHAHPPTSTGQEIYELCGHVFLNPRLKHEVVDLR